MTKQVNPIVSNADQIRKNIKTIRHFMQMSQKEFAESCEINLSRYKQLEAGTSTTVVNYYDLIRIARIINADSEDLIHKNFQLKLI